MKMVLHSIKIHVAKVQRDAHSFSLSLLGSTIRSESDSESELVHLSVLVKAVVVLSVVGHLPCEDESVI
jgi:hypothetical protein